MLTPNDELYWKFMITLILVISLIWQHMDRLEILPREKAIIYADSSRILSKIKYNENKHLHGQSTS